MMNMYMGGTYKLEDNRRIAVNYAKWEHARNALQIFEEERDEVNAQLLRREMELLRPYWEQPDVAKEQAVEAYSRDHPEGTPKS